MYETFSIDLAYQIINKKYLRLSCKSGLNIIFMKKRHTIVSLNLKHCVKYSKQVKLIMHKLYITKILTFELLRPYFPIIHV